MGTSPLERRARRSVDAQYQSQLSDAGYKKMQVEKAIKAMMNGGAVDHAFGPAKESLLGDYLSAIHGFLRGDIHNAEREQVLNKNGLAKQWYRGGYESLTPKQKELIDWEEQRRIAEWQQRSPESKKIREAKTLHNIGDIATVTIPNIIDTKTGGFGTPIMRGLATAMLADFHTDPKETYRGVAAQHEYLKNNGLSGAANKAYDFAADFFPMMQGQFKNKYSPKDFIVREALPYMVNKFHEQVPNLVADAIAQDIPPQKRNALNETRNAVEHAFGGNNEFEEAVEQKNRYSGYYESPYGRINPNDVILPYHPLNIPF